MRAPAARAGGRHDKTQKRRLVGPVAGEAHRRPREGAEPDLQKSLRRCGREVGIKTRANDATVICIYRMVVDTYKTYLIIKLQAHHVI